jgi:hypothetical protein
MLVEILALLVSCVTPQTLRNTMAGPTPSNLFIGDKAREALKQIKTTVLIVPEGTQSLRLQSVQIPESEEGGLPFLFTYTDGQRTVSLTEIAGANLSFQPAGTVTATMSSTANVRGGKEAAYTEITQPEGKTIELMWREEGLTISLRSEQADLNYLIATANALIYLR